MNKAMRKTLSAGEVSLVEETKPAHLESLDEDALIALHTRVRRARTKYTKNYRRAGAEQVKRKGGRYAKGGKQKRMGVKAEVFEDALSRVSRQLAEVSRRSADELRDERLAAARAAKGDRPDVQAPPNEGAVAVTAAPASTRRGDRSLKSPASTRRVASSRSTGARRQAAKDSR
jgi:hypothetical protein